jgi:SSS family solute:Na+ symporter
MLAGMLAAYVSTIITHLNWGSSYLVNDFYQRFLVPGKTERHYVNAGRLASVFLMMIAGALTFVLDTAAQSFQLLLSIGAGTGLLYLLRWFWWRINAWCEIAAMVGSFVVALGFFVAGKQGIAIPSSIVLLSTIAATTVIWVTTALLTAPTDRAVLRAFYTKVRPAGPGWRDIRAETGLPPSQDSLPQAFLGWTLGVMMVYGALFGTGSLLYGRMGIAAFWLVTCVICALWLARLLPDLWRDRTAD